LSESRPEPGGEPFTEEVSFSSGADLIRGTLYRPGSLARPPVVVLAGGWCYVKELVLPVYAEALAAAGIAALTFDYRRLGASGGEPRQHLDPNAQMEDYRNAISFLETRVDVDAERLGIFGISYSGGHVLILGATDSRVRAVASVVPVVDGLRTLRLAHGTVGFRRLTRAVEEARRHLFQTGEHLYMPHGSSDPYNELATWPFPSSQPLFQHLKETQAPLYENRATVASTEMLLRYTVYPFVNRLIDTPTLMVVAREDDHTMWDLEIEAFGAIVTPKKELYVVEEVGHLSLYGKPDEIRRVAQACADWFRKWLTSASQSTDRLRARPKLQNVSVSSPEGDSVAALSQ
jgi:uncharacterized protein